MPDLISEAFCFSFSTRGTKDNQKTLENSRREIFGKIRSEDDSWTQHTSLLGGGGRAFAGEGGRDLAVLALVALEYIGHGR